LWEAAEEVPLHDDIYRTEQPIQGNHGEHGARHQVKVVCLSIQEPDAIERREGEQHASGARIATLGTPENQRKETCAYDGLQHEPGEFHHHALPDPTPRAVDFLGL
jgi:hypothetical protein